MFSFKKYLKFSYKEEACKTSCGLLLMQRRRDRINEKMKALQELIPRCNKVNLHFSVYAFKMLEVLKLLQSR